jgi:hypothetical protein
MRHFDLTRVLMITQVTTKSFGHVQAGVTRVTELKLSRVLSLNIYKDYGAMKKKKQAEVSWSAITVLATVMLQTGAVSS